MRKIAMVFLAAVLTAGCSLYRNTLPAELVSTIEPNVTTKDQIMAKFGKPIRTGVDSGFETWRYNYRGVTAKEGWINRDLYLIFNKNKTVQKFSYDENVK